MTERYGSGGALAPAWQPARPTGALARRSAVLLLLLGVTFGQRFCFPLGTFQISIVVPLAYLAIYLLLASGQLRINTIAIVLYAATITAMIATLYIGKANFSPFSFWYLIVLYFVYIFSVDVPLGEYLDDLEIFQKLLLILAGIAFLQFAEQLLSGATFSIFAYIPHDYWLFGYNTRPTIAYESMFHKANAEFFLEPSFLSQYMAIGIIIEMLYFARWRRIAVYAAAIFTSFSGTGMVLLALFAIAAIVRSKRYEFLYAVPILVFLYIVFQDNPYVTAITGRVNEFDSENSSAFVRFIGPNEALAELIYPDFLAFLVGKGPGAVDHLGRSLDFVSNFPVMHKVLIEYGIVGFVPFMTFITYRFFAAARSRLLAAALFIMYLFLSGSLLQPHTIYLFYVLTIMMPRTEMEA
ncbi:MAG TPA: hypothetical protein VFA50_13425 [Stellaceae bacterium]|nr:hypothetical protein [Stellaceae bacterium]